MLLLPFHHSLATQNDLSVVPPGDLRSADFAGKPFAFPLASTIPRVQILAVRIGRFANRMNHARTNSTNDRKIAVRILLRGSHSLYLPVHIGDVDAMVSPARTAKLGG